MSVYLSELEKVPRISVEERKILIEQAVLGNKTARDCLIKNHLYYVVNIVRTVNEDSDILII